MLYKNNSYVTIEVSNFKFGTIVSNIKKYDSSSIFGYNKNFSSTNTYDPITILGYNKNLFKCF